MQPTSILRPLAIAALVLALALTTTPLLVASDDALPLIDPQEVRPINAEEFQEVLAHYRGKVVMVNLWATWCIPCVLELPDLQELAQRYQAKGLVVLGVSLDEPDELEEKVRPFFKKHAPELVSYLQAGDEKEFTDLFDPNWPGALPTTFLLDRDGEKRRTLMGRKTFQEFEAAVVPLLE